MLELRTRATHQLLPESDAREAMRFAESLSGRVIFITHKPLILNIASMGKGKLRCDIGNGSIVTMDREWNIISCLDNDEIAALVNKRY